MSVDVSRADLPAWLRGGTVTLQAVLAILIAFLGGIAVAAAGQGLLVDAGVLAGGTPAARTAATALQYVGFFLATGLFLQAIRRYDLLDGRVRPPTRREAAWIGGGLAALLVSSVAIEALLSGLGVTVAQNRVVRAGMETPRLFLYMIPATVLFVAPGEELVYRGVVQGLYREAFGPRTAVAAASLLFGVSHWLALVGTGGARVTYVLVAATLGLVLGVVYEYTRNLAVPVAVHGLYNAAWFGFSYAAATGLV